MDTTTTTFWVRDGKVTELPTVLLGITSLREIHNSRAEAERAEPDNEYRKRHTFEITVTDHGPAPEPTWWWAFWATPNDWVIHKDTSPVFTFGLDHGPTGTTAFVRVLSTSEADARAKAIEAWREAGFLPVLERAGLEVS